MICEVCGAEKEAGEKGSCAVPSNTGRYDFATNPSSTIIPAKGPYSRPCCRSSSLRTSGSILLMGIGRVFMSRTTDGEKWSATRTQRGVGGVKSSSVLQYIQYTPHCGSCTAKRDLQRWPTVVPQIMPCQHRHHRHSSSNSLRECLEMCCRGSLTGQRFLAPRGQPSFDCL